MGRRAVGNYLETISAESALLLPDRLPHGKRKNRRRFCLVFAVEPPVPPFPRPAVKPIPVKVVVVANFGPGNDTDDAPGEFQFWAERLVRPVSGWDFW